MRVAVTKPLRIEPGDQIVVQARFPANAPGWGRLYVFASEGDVEFSPYVANVNHLEEDMPRMYYPVSMRVMPGETARQLSFVSDIDGRIVVMQEMDTPRDPRAQVKVRRTINPALPWQQRLSRQLRGLFQ